MSYSGGMSSFAEAKLCVDEFGKDNVRLLFADTLTEDADLYRFLEETSSYLRCELITIKDGRNIWEVFDDKKFIGNYSFDVCSRVLKRELLTNYLHENFGKKTRVLTGKKTPTGRSQYKTTYLPDKDVVVHVGIDLSESHRLTAIQNYMYPWKYDSLLVRKGIIVDKNYSERFGIKKPRLYSLGYSHNNCGGFCVKAGLGHFKLLFDTQPELYKYHEEKEQELMKKHNCLPFLRKTINRKLVPISMKDYRTLYLETDAEVDLFDIGGCGCALPV